MADDPAHIDGSGPAGGLMLPHPQKVAPADQLLHAANAQPRHDLPQLLGDEEHEIHHIFRFALEALAKLRVLGGDAHRAGIQIAYPHHHAAHADQRRGSKAEFLRAQHAGDGHVPAAHELAVGLDGHPGAQPVQRKGLMRLRHAQFPGQARVVDGGTGRRAGAAVAAGNQDHLRPGLGHARGHRAYARLADQLDGDPRPPVGALQVVNQLSQILDGINIMMGRRGNQAHAGGGQPGFGDPRIDLAAGQVSALAGLGSLRHFDLNFLGAHQVFAGHAEAAGGDLLDLGAALRVQPFFAFAALAGIGSSAQPVHGLSQTFVSLLRNRAVGHGPGLEALHNFGSRLHLFQRNGSALVKREFQRAAQRVGPCLVVHHGSVLAEPLHAAFPHSPLQGHDGLGIVEVIFLIAAAAQTVIAQRIQRGIRFQIQRIEGPVVAVLHVLVDLFQPDAAHPGNGVGKIAVDHVLTDAHGLENLCALIGLQNGNAHLGGHLAHALHHRADIVLLGGVTVLVQQPLFDQLIDAFQRQIGVDGSSAVAQQQGEMMDVPRVGCFQNHADGRAAAGIDEMMLQRRHCQQGRNRHMVFIHSPVGQDKHVGPVLVGPVAGHEQMIQRPFDGLGPVIQNGDIRYPQGFLLCAADAQKVSVGQNGLFQPQHGAVLRLVLQQVAVAAHVYRRIGDDFLPNGVDRRVGDLREELPEIGKQHLMLFRKHGQRNIRPHGSRRLRAGTGHGKDDLLHVLVGIAESLVQPIPGGLLQRRNGMVGQRQVVERKQVAVQPFAIGLAGGVFFLQLAVLDDSLLHRIHQQHLAGAHPGFFHDPLRRNVQHAYLAGKNQHVVIRNIVAGGPQSVAVQHCAHHVAVGEQDGSRAVPRLHHSGVIAVQIPPGAGNIPLVLPRLRDGHHHGQRQRHAVHHQEFQRIVQHGRVAALAVDDGQHLIHIAFHQWRAEGLLPGDHPVHVAADGVDFAVVQDEPVGVGPFPAGEGVGGKTGMHHGNGAGEILALQIRIKGAQLTDQKHALIHHRAAGQRAYIRIGVALLKGPANHIQPPVKVDALLQPVGTGNKALLDHGHAGPCPFTQHLRANRHRSPAQKPQSFLLGHDLHQLPGLRPFQMVGGQKQHAHAVIPLGGQVEAQLQTAEKSVGNLRHDAHAVAGAAVGVLACAMLQLFYNFQRLIYRAAGLEPLDADHGSNSAGVVFHLRQI